MLINVCNVSTSLKLVVLTLTVSKLAVLFLLITLSLSACHYKKKVYQFNLK